MAQQWNAISYLKTQETSNQNKSKYPKLSSNHHAVETPRHKEWYPHRLSKNTF